MERWEPISDTTGDYLVSNLGRVMNGRTGKILKPRPIPNGYLRVHLPCDGGRIDLYIHRLVAKAFCNHPDGCDVINHIDNNPKNNNANNLEWTTQRGNVIYAMKQGRVHNFPNAKPVVCVKTGKEYCSIHEAAICEKCDHKTISRRIKNGEYILRKVI